MRTLLISGFIFVGFACSSFQNENNDVTYRWENSSLVIENGSAQAVYYAVFDQNILAVIDWVPASTEENRLLPNEMVEISEEAILGYEDGNTIVLFLWNGDEPPFTNFQSHEVETDQF